MRPRFFRNCAFLADPVGWTEAAQSGGWEPSDGTRGKEGQSVSGRLARPSKQKHA